jgi:uncharacterized cupredoxin-like copper-binding protein
LRSSRLAFLTALTFVAAACSTPAGAMTPWTAAPPTPLVATPAATEAASNPPVAATPAPSTPVPATRIEVALTDGLRIEPVTMTVPMGVAVTFVVTNAGVLEHEFYLGDEMAQADHDLEMAAGGMAHDDPEGIAVDPGETRELTYTFSEAGETVAGCHVIGHYAAGMRAVITVAG